MSVSRTSGPTPKGRSTNIHARALAASRLRSSSASASYPEGCAHPPRSPGVRTAHLCGCSFTAPSTPKGFGLHALPAASVGRPAQPQASPENPKIPWFGLAPRQPPRQSPPLSTPARGPEGSLADASASSHARLPLARLFSSRASRSARTRRPAWNVQPEGCPRVSSRSSTVEEGTSDT